MGSKGIQFHRLEEADRLVCEGPCKFWGLILSTRSRGGDVTVYNGRDATSGRRFHRFEGADDVSQPFLLAEPVHFDGGLFVDVGGHVNEVTVLWEEAEDPREVGF